jgi:hypothetical protein
MQLLHHEIVTHLIMHQEEALPLSVHAGLDNGQKKSCQCPEKVNFNHPLLTPFS